MLPLSTLLVGAYVVWRVSKSAEFLPGHFIIRQFACERGSATLDCKLCEYFIQKLPSSVRHYNSVMVQP